MKARSPMIRPFNSSDTDAVMQAWHKASALAHPFLSDDLIAKADALIRNTFLPMADTSVIEQEGQVVGFIALLGHQVGGLFLDPAYHRCGLGKALMDHAAQNHPVLELEVFRDNAIGRGFYATYGFEELEEKIDDFSGLPVLRLHYSTT